MDKAKANGRRRVKVPGEPYLYERMTAAGERVYEVAWRDHERRQRFRTVQGGIMAARAERDRILGARANGEPVQANPRLRFGEAARSYVDALDARELRDTTKAEQRRIVERHLLPRLPGARMDRITPDDLVRLLADLREAGLGDRSLTLVLGTVGRVYKHAARRLGWAGANPVLLLDRHERPKSGPTHRRAIFAGTELEETIAAAREPARTLFKLMTATGCRVSEALALRWSDLDLSDEDPCVTFEAQLDRKGNRHPLKRRDNGTARVVPIPQRLAAALRAYAASVTTPGEYVFATRTGRPLSQRNVARSLRAAQKAARRPDGTPTFPALHELDERNRPVPVKRGELPSLHSFRHTAATRFLYAGDSADEVAALLGHKDATVTRVVYLHEIENAERRALRRSKIDAEFGAALDA